jgi:hypothetical protein
MKRLALLLTLTALAACVSPEQIAAEDQAYCIRYGFTPGTQGHAQCMLTVAQMRQQRDLAARQMLFNYGMALQARPAYQPAPRMTPFTCTTQGAFTNCW